MSVFFDTFSTSLGSARELKDKWSKEEYYGKDTNSRREGSNIVLRVRKTSTKSISDITTIKNNVALQK